MKIDYLARTFLERRFVFWFTSPINGSKSKHKCPKSSMHIVLGLNDKDGQKPEVLIM